MLLCDLGEATTPLLDVATSPRVDPDFYLLNVAINSLGKCDSGHITLPGAWFPPIWSSTLFVRPFYADLYTHVLEKARLDPKHSRTFLILGTPGIGKTAFGLYFLVRCIKKGLTVVYQHSRFIGSFVFSNGSVRTILISDGIEPPCVPAFTVIISYMCKARCWEVYKTPGSVGLHFPVFSEAEVEECAAVCYPEQPISEVRERYRKFGGMARYIFSHTDKHHERGLDGKLVRTKWERLLLALHCGPDEDNDRRSDTMLVHAKIRGELQEREQLLKDQHDDTNVLGMRRWQHSIERRVKSSHVLTPKDAEYYQFARGEMGSLYIKQHLMEDIRKDIVERTGMAGFIERVEDVAWRWPAAGLLYEGFSLAQISRGGTFPLRQLHRGNDCGGAVTFATSQVLGFDSRSLQQTFDSHGAQETYLPIQSATCTIDAVLPQGRPACVTIKAHDGIILEATERRGQARPLGLCSLVAALGIGAEADIAFYWIVPYQKLFESFSAQPFMQEGTLVKDVQSHPVASRVRQYVVLVPPNAAP